MLLCSVSLCWPGSSAEAQGLQGLTPARIICARLATVLAAWREQRKSYRRAMFHVHGRKEATAVLSSAAVVCWCRTRPTAGEEIIVQDSPVDDVCDGCVMVIIQRDY